MKKVSEIAEHIQGEIIGDQEIIVSGICDLNESISGHISFLGNPKYEKYFSDSLASVVIVPQDFDLPHGDKTLIKVNNPFMGFTRTLSLFNSRPERFSGIHQTAVIGKNVVLGKDVAIDSLAVIKDNVKIGTGTFIGSGTVVGNGSNIGENTTIHANVTIYDKITIGDSVTIDSGSIIGADGFGWFTDQGIHYKIPQIGGVIIENEVWIGSNCTIDRSTFNNTVIGENTKMDNSIHIAHNVKIGKGCLFASFVGIAGSSVIGDYVTLAGQVGVADHLSIGDRCIVASKSAVLQSLEPGSFVSGIPARDHSARKRQDVVINQLPEMLKRVRVLENQFNEL